MREWMILIAVLSTAVLLALAVTLVCFFKMFYAVRRRPKNAEEYPTPEGAVSIFHRAFYIPPRALRQDCLEALIPILPRLPNAGHGLCFPVDMQGYLAELDAFFAPYV